MGSPHREPRALRQYPRKAEINRAVQAARDCGIVVAAIECSPDGTIRMSTSAEPSARAANAFDLWDEAGKL